MTDLVRAIAGKPWLITEEGLQFVLAIASRGEHFPEVLRRRLDTDQPMQGGAHPLKMDGGVAVIKILGPLCRHADMMGDISGATSYGAIRKQMQAAMADPLCKAVLLKVDSPGGEANGCQDLAAQIRAWSAEKPVVAYVEGNGASAAYWLTSAASKVICGATSFLGSIGTRCAITDDSAAQEKLGVRRIEIVSSQTPGKRGRPVDDEVLGRVQTVADDLTQVFAGAVAKYRSTTADKVLEDYGGGDILIGGKAVDAGLADEIGDYETALGTARRLGDAAAAKKQKTQTGAPPVRRAIMSKTLAERLNALATHETMQGSAMHQEALTCAAEAQKLQDENHTLKAAKADLMTEVEGYRFGAALDTAVKERRITSPAQLESVRATYAGDLPGLHKYLKVHEPSAALDPATPATVKQVKDGAPAIVQEAMSPMRAKMLADAGYNVGGAS